jgi:hypothetical protein
VAACFFVFALAGVSSLKSEEPRRVPGKIFVRAVHGQATYSREGTSHDLKANTTLDAGVTITTGPDSYVYVDVNGTTSSVRIAAETILALKTVDRVGPRREGETETMLVLQVGSVLGRVPKLPANSKYEITTPCGVAGVRGTDWSVVVTQLGASQYEATFQSVQGALVASAPAAGSTETRTLKSGEAWTVGRDVVPVERKVLRRQLDQIDEMIRAAAPPPGLGGPMPGQAPAAGAGPRH